MSCISFFTQRQCDVLRQAREDGVELGPVATFASPGVSEGKIRRLRAMATAADPRVRESAALNAHVPVDVLEVLAADPEMGVRCCVARSPQATPELLVRLAADDVAGVRGWVAAHRATPREVVEQLAADPDRSVRDVAAWNLRWPASRADA